MEVHPNRHLSEDQEETHNRFSRHIEYRKRTFQYHHLHEKFYAALANKDTGNGS